MQVLARLTVPCPPFFLTFGTRLPICLKSATGVSMMKPKQQVQKRTDLECMSEWDRLAIYLEIDQQTLFCGG